MQEIIVNVEYTKKVITDLNRNNYKYINRIWKYIFNTLAAINIICSAILLILASYNVFTLKIILCQILMAVIVVLLNTNILPDFLTKQFLKKDKVSLGLNSKMIFKKDCVVVENKLETMKVTYEKLNKVMETKKYIYLYITKKKALIITKKDVGEDKLLKLVGMLSVGVDKYIDYIK